MSLRDCGVFEPLRADHPAVGSRCWICSKMLAAGTRVALRPTETPEQSGGLTVEARVICATCYLRGSEVMTPAGARIVERVKDGDASPYPVETTDGKQWRADEIGKVES